MGVVLHPYASYRFNEATAGRDVICAAVESRRGVAATQMRLLQNALAQRELPANLSLVSAA